MQLIIGYGNTLRGDDGAGCYAAQEIMTQIAREDVSVLVAHQLTVEMVEPISRAEQVLFIDACEGDAAGEIRAIPVSPLAEEAIFTHTVTPAALVAGALLLYGAAPNATLFTVCGGSFAYGEGLSPPVAAALPNLVAQVISKITPFMP